MRPLIQSVARRSNLHSLQIRSTVVLTRNFSRSATHLHNTSTLATAPPGSDHSYSAAKMEPQVDYSLYLVTDSTPAILGGRDLVEVVEQALLGGG